MKRSSTWLFLGALALGALAFGQPPGAVQLRIGPVYTNEFPKLDIVVEASAGGLTGAPLNASDLILIEEGIRTSAALSLRKFSETGQGVTVLLALDASGSMRGRPLEAVRKGLGQFVSKARDNDKVGIVSFADDVRWESPWSGTREETRRKLEQIQARGRRTVLWDALEAALDELAKVDGPARRHLVVISDGHDEGSKNSLAEVIAKAVSLHIPVDAIGMSRGDPRYLENLKALSAQSKGSYTTAPDLDALTQLVGHAIDRMLDSPVARFQVEKLKADGASHRVGVYWKTANLEDETAVAFPQPTQQQVPSVPAQQPPAPTTLKMFQWWYVAIAAGVAALFLVAWLLLRRRKKPSPPSPSPWLPAPGLPYSPSPIPPPPGLPDSLTPGLLDSSTARLPVPPSPIPPPPGLPDSLTPRLLDSSTARLPVPPSPVPPPPGLPDSQTPSLLDSQTPRLPDSQTPRLPARARTQFATPFRPPALLIAKSGPFAGKTFRIDRNEFWVGAAENNDLQLDDETVSGNHALFRFEAQTLKVFDNRSTNDTWVNRQAVGGTARVLFPGDEIRIGQSVFVIERSLDETARNVAQPGPPFALS